MDWAFAGAKLNACYGEVMQVAKDAYPELSGSHGWSTEVNVATTFVGHAVFCYDPAYQEHEDLVLKFVCGPAERGFWNPDGSPRFPGASGRDAVVFDIERGGGPSLATSLEPVLLPSDDESEQYRVMVLEYVDRTVAFVDAHMDFILELLRTRYQA